MCAVYLYQLPLVLAIVLNARGLSLGVSAFEPRFAKKNAEKRMTKKKSPGKKRKKKIPMRKEMELAYKMLKVGKLERLDVRITLGTGDAALTAQACGLFMIFCHTLSAVTGARGAVRVTPDFGGQSLSGEACGIVRLRAGHIMKAAAQTILRGAGG